MAFWQRSTTNSRVVLKMHPTPTPPHRFAGGGERRAEREKMTTNFKLDADADGIATITWDQPGSAMNLIGIATIQELADLVEKTTADENIKGIVITSGKDTFCAGADLTLLNTMRASFAEM